MRGAVLDLPQPSKQQVNSSDDTCGAMLCWEGNCHLTCTFIVKYCARTLRVVAWGIVGRKSQAPQKVTKAVFEIERDGQLAFLEYSLTEKVLGLIHTEIPSTLRGLG